MSTNQVFSKTGRSWFLLTAATVLLTGSAAFAEDSKEAAAPAAAPAAAQAVTPEPTSPAPTAVAPQSAAPATASPTAAAPEPVAPAPTPATPAPTAAAPEPAAPAAAPATPAPTAAVPEPAAPAPTPTTPAPNSAASAEPETKVAKDVEAEPKAEKKKKVHPLDAHKKKKNVDGYYSSIGRETDEAKQEVDGYYGSFKKNREIPYATPPKDEPRPPVVTTPPVVTPPVTVAPLKKDGTERKFADDTGETGSITVTRHFNKAKEFMASGHYEYAKKHWREAIHAAPERMEFYPPLYETCVKTNDWSSAADTLEKMMKGNPAAEKQWTAAYGEALFNLRRYDRANAELKKALGFGKNAETIHRTMLKIAKLQNNSPAMNTEYAEVLKLKPSDGEMHLEYGNYLVNLDRKQDALSHYKAAAKLLPSNADLHARLAYMLLYYNKDYAGAITSYTKAIEAGGSKPDYTRGLQYAEQQQELAKKKK